MITLLIIRSSIIFQEVSYFENSTISSSLRRQALLYVAVQIPGMANDNSKGNSRFQASVAL